MLIWQKTFHIKINTKRNQRIKLTTLKQLRVVIASPNDVKEEREALDKVINRINRNTAESQGLILKTVRWETDSYPGFHIDGAQGLIDPILKIEDCDIFICIFWKRFGKPIKKGGKTGTEHEFYKASEKWKQNRKPQIMLYFNQKEYYPKNSKESEQQTAILKFKESLPKEGLYCEYNGITQFKEIVLDHLTRYLNRFYTQIPKEGQISTNEDGNDIKRHFSDLKERVIEPTIKILKNNPEFLPKLNEVINQKQRHYFIDKDFDQSIYSNTLDDNLTENVTIEINLCKDLLNNHYPKIIDKWSNLQDKHGKFEQKIKQINQTIENKLKNYLDKKVIKYRYENENQRIDSIPINKFVKRFCALIKYYQSFSFLITFV